MADAKKEEKKEEKVLTFNEKVIAIQNRLNAPKSRFNKFGNYSYRSLEDILEGVKPLLKEYGLILTINDEIVLIGDRYYVKATATLHGENGGAWTSSAFAREAESKKGMDESQITGSASSYARKYALNGLLCIDDIKDADTNEQREQTEGKGPNRLINEEEITKIEEACAEKEGRKEAVLKWAKIKSFEEMTIDKYNAAMERFGK